MLRGNVQRKKAERLAFYLRRPPTARNERGVTYSSVAGTTSLLGNDAFRTSSVKKKSSPE
jgi:hypothetical protein